MNRTLVRNGWRRHHLVMAILLAAAGVLATRQAWADILHLSARDDEFSHLYLVVPVAAWLAWVRRGRLRACVPTGQMMGVFIIALGWAIHSIGYYNAIESFWHGGALLVVVGSLLTVLGRDILVNYLPAFVVLLFLIPVPGLVRQQIALPLQAWVAQSTEQILRVAGVAVARSGNLLSINGRHVAIAEACNGMRLVFALLLVSYCLAFSMPLRPYVRTIILVASPVSAVLCNVLRTVPAVWLYGYAPSLADTFHEFSGWSMLLAAFFMLRGVIRLLRWATVPVTRFTLACE